jgi:hypothetical protein
MTDLQPYLQKVIERWRVAEVAIPDGVDRNAIAGFEARCGVRLPADMREYFATVNGMGNRAEMDDDMYGFWRLEEVQPVASYCPNVAERFPGAAEYYLFCDYSIDLFMYAIRLNRDEKVATPIAKIYPQVNCRFDHRFGSFTELLATYANNPNDLL